MKRILLMLPLISILFFAGTPAKADFSLGYPDNSFALVQAIGGTGHAFIFADFSTFGDDDIFTLHTNHSSFPLSASLVGFSSGIGYYLDFRFVNVSGFFVYDVFATQGGSFFFVGTFFL